MGSDIAFSANALASEENSLLISKFLPRSTTYGPSGPAQLSYSVQTRLPRPQIQIPPLRQTSEDSREGCTRITTSR